MTTARVVREATVPTEAASCEYITVTRKIRIVGLKDPQRDRLPHQLFEFDGSLSRDEVDYEFEASADTGFADHALRQERRRPVRGLQYQRSVGLLDSRLEHERMS